MKKKQDKPVDEQKALDGETVELALSRWIERKKKTESIRILLEKAKQEVSRQARALEESTWEESLTWRALLRARGDLVD